MTILVAVETKAGVTVATDSQVSDSFSSYILPESQSKVGFRGPYLIGTAGLLRVGQVMLHADDIPVPNSSVTDEELNKFMITKFSWATQDTLKISGIERQVDSERVFTDSEMLVCVNGRAYSIGGDYAVMRATDKTAIADGVVALGSGLQFALGAYYALSQRRTKPSPMDIATTMVEAAIRWDHYCGGPIRTYTQSRP
jgi:ATP-dependent protease HslVU (ClpYQ) peptidase subunit